MNAVQITTIVILVVATACITAVSIYLILFLKDLRCTTQNANKVIKDVSHITGAVGGPLAAAAGFMENVARGTKAFKIISSIFDKEEEE